MITLETLNHVSEAQFLELTGGTLEGELWLAERVVAHRPFADVAAIISAFETVITAASQDEKIRLIASHPDLGVKVKQNLSAASVSEQAAAGLDQLTQTEFDTFQSLNTQYRERFGFPFVICARENSKDSILAAFQQRLSNPIAQEIEIGVSEIVKIIRLRLLDIVQTPE